MLKILRFSLIYIITPFFGWAQHWSDVGGASLMIGFNCDLLIADTTNHALYISGPYYDNGTIHLEDVVLWDGVSFYPVGCQDGRDLTGCGYIGGFSFIDTTLYIGAQSSHAANCYPNNPIATSPIYFNGVQWKAFDSINDISVPDFYGFVKYQNQILVYGDGPIDMPNPFTGISDTFNNIAAWDGTWWQPLGQGNNSGARYYAPGSPFTGFIYSAVEFNGELFVGGLFNYAGGVAWPSGGVARWNGTAWSGCGNNTLDQVYLCNCNNSLYAGLFTGGGVYKWDGMQFNLIGQAPAVPGNTTHVLTCLGNNLIVGGRFNSIDNVPALNIAMYDGQQWSAIDSGLYGLSGQAFVSDLEVLDGWLYATGGFTEAGANHATVNTIARIGITTGIDNNNTNDLQLEINPNPTSALLNIIFKQKGVPTALHLYIYNMIGIKIMESTLENNLSLDISNLKNDIYFLKVRDKKGNLYSKRFVVMR